MKAITPQQQKLLRQWGIPQSDQPLTEAGAAAMLDAMTKRYAKPQLPKLTPKQNDLLVRMSQGELLCGDPGSWQTYRQPPKQGEVCTGHFADRVVDALEAKGLIEWQPCTDGHDRRWVVTKRGLSLASQAAEKKAADARPEPRTSSHRRHQP